MFHKILFDHEPRSNRGLKNCLVVAVVLLVVDRLDIPYICDRIVILKVGIQIMCVVFGGRRACFIRGSGDNRVFIAILLVFVALKALIALTVLIVLTVLIALRVSIVLLVFASSWSRARFTFFSLVVVNQTMSFLCCL